MDELCKATFGASSFYRPWTDDCYLLGEEENAATPRAEEGRDIAPGPSPAGITRADIEKFVDDLNDSTLYTVEETTYAGNRNFPMFLHVRRGLGWPQAATVIVEAATGRLLMAFLVNTRDFTSNRITAVIVDEGFLANAVPNGRVVRYAGEDAGTRFFEAYRKATGQSGRE